MVLLEIVSATANYYHGTSRRTTGVQCVGMSQVEGAWHCLLGICRKGILSHKSFITVLLKIGSVTANSYYGTSRMTTGVQCVSMRKVKGV